MDALTTFDSDAQRTARINTFHFSDVTTPSAPAPASKSWTANPGRLAFQIVAVFLAYYVAGKLGQATTNIRSSNLGPVWPACGIALAAFLACGKRVWPGIVASAFLVASSSSVPALAAAGQAIGATVAALTGATLLRRIPGFDPSLPRLRDALGLIVVGAFGSATISASIGILSLFLTHVQAYSGLSSAWFIYWFGDSTGVLLITPLVFTLPSLFGITSWRRAIEWAALLTLLTATCFMVFADLPFFSVRLHVLAFAVLPFVMWAAIRFGVGGASLSVFVIATIATLATALGLEPLCRQQLVHKRRSPRCALCGPRGERPLIGGGHHRANPRGKRTRGARSRTERDGGAAAPGHHRGVVQRCDLFGGSQRHPAQLEWSRAAVFRIHLV